MASPVLHLNLFIPFDCPFNAVLRSLLNILLVSICSLENIFGLSVTGQELTEGSKKIQKGEKVHIAEGVV